MMTSHSENLRKLWDNANAKEISQQQAILLYALQVSPEERAALFEKICEWVFARMYQPKDGYTPQKGLDYFDAEAPTKEELLALIKPLLPSNADLVKLIKPLLPSDDDLRDLIEPLIPYVKDGADGKTPGKDDLVAIMKPLVEQILAERTPEQRSIDILGLAEMPGASPVDKITGIVEPIIRELMGKQKRGWFGGGGGGDQVRAGTGVTLTTNGIGAKVISIASPTAPVTGTVDGSTVAFTFGGEPKWVVADGITYYDGAGYTYSSGTVTMTIPPSQYIRAII